MSRKAGLTPRQALFVREYLIDLNGAQAAIRAGYAPKCADVCASRLMVNIKVQELVAAAMAKRAERTEINADWVLKRWAAIAETDARDLVQYVRGPCPKCWPDEGQQTVNAECSACGGRGKGHVVVSDTRTLSPGAAQLYDGVQVGRDGIKVNMRNRDAALVNVARHLGMFNDKLELGGGLNVTISGTDADL